ncbi:putative MFS family arabinose efflux permease [Kribbella amoyensis]|uniref:Putative MFS family arabinose efflux permease n=1 Tax=Kribbella amoyensis TaxID=996641 RepID=A0A561BQ81_9ACTN|nr:MFS transporter [Kribbella amoyensis]TWD81045.1 putative MFS family arabinose efflux permease [Kribbella amoyensis]
MTTGIEQRADPRRWWALAAVSIAQLMFAVDGTIMNIALPSVGATLRMSETASWWVVTSYALAFGVLLLPGGRVGQWIGYRRALLVGLVGFALASLLGGLATAGWMLITARSAQGVFGSLLTPAALALLSTTFSTAERGRAFGIFATIMGSGSAIGMLAGGLLTQYLNWRWALLVNVPITAIAIVLALYAVRPGSVDQRSGPLFPLALLRHRPRTAAYVAMFAWGIAVISAFLQLSFFLQDTLGYDAARAGLAFLAYPLAIQVGVRVVRGRMTVVPARTLLVPGLVLIGSSYFLLTRLTPESAYLPNVVLVFLLLGLGTSLVLPVANSTATLGAGSSAGVAGAAGSTSVQLGAALGTAVIPQGSVVTAVLLVAGAGLVWAIGRQP